MTDFEYAQCSSCGRRIGLVTSDQTSKHALYCDRWCLEEPKITKMEERNDEWRAMAAMGVSPIRIARVYEVVHPMVYKVLNRE